MRANSTLKVIAWAVCGLELVALFSLLVLLFIPLGQQWDVGEVVVGVGTVILLLLIAGGLYYLLSREAGPYSFSSRMRRTIRVFGLILAGIGLLVLIGGLSLSAGAFGLGVLMGDLFLNGWALYAFLRHRQGRQDELVQVLAASVNGGVPL